MAEDCGISLPRVKVHLRYFLAVWPWACPLWVSHVAQLVKNLPAMQETQVQSLGQEDPLKKEYPLQYSCLKNSMDRGAWQATVPGATKSQARLCN